MNKVESTVLRQQCIVKIYRGIPIKNNEYKQYVIMKPEEIVKICKNYYKKILF
jgi:hypothetical protein